MVVVGTGVVVVGAGVVGAGVVGTGVGVDDDSADRSRALARVASIVSGAMTAGIEAATVMVIRDFMVVTCPLVCQTKLQCANERACR
ncbi:hypothetical protein [Nocardioides sp. B-3]|uniref:hypothetical protein n=1 Tax=Nocardioides sp. B-3 TaxID=2895565 RepID=UPI002152FC2B|nr:hypothetical protein [Nocardioides sp. B-3]UUZ58134.1 hypothetical protein LP418_17900 [Nocardioides sp. B-3]